MTIVLHFSTHPNRFAHTPVVDRTLLSPPHLSLEPPCVVPRPTFPPCLSVAVVIHVFWILLSCPLLMMHHLLLAYPLPLTCHLLRMNYLLQPLPLPCDGDAWPPTYGFHIHPLSAIDCYGFASAALLKSTTRPLETLGVSWVTPATQKTISTSTSSNPSFTLISLAVADGAHRPGPVVSFAHAASFPSPTFSLTCARPQPWWRSPVPHRWAMAYGKPPSVSGMPAAWVAACLCWRQRDPVCVC